jgi:hypothetical protein
MKKFISFMTAGALWSCANPIEPSARGGAKIAQAISKFAGGATPRSSVFTDQ